jgi:hypothetical protein
VRAIDAGGHCAGLMTTDLVWQVNVRRKSGDYTARGGLQQVRRQGAVFPSLIDHHYPQSGQAGALPARAGAASRRARAAQALSKITAATGCWVARFRTGRPSGCRLLRDGGCYGVIGGFHPVSRPDSNQRALPSADQLTAGSERSPRRHLAYWPCSAPRMASTSCLAPRSPGISPASRSAKARACAYSPSS